MSEGSCMECALGHNELCMCTFLCVLGGVESVLSHTKL